jgi:hypothetical protein
MKTVSTYRELKSELNADGQGSGTVEGWVEFEGKKMFIRKHWSYDGGFPAYTDETISNCIGELFPKGEWFPWLVDGVQQLRHGYIELQDCKLTFINEKN